MSNIKMRSLIIKCICIIALALPLLYSVSCDDMTLPQQQFYGGGDDEVVIDQPQPGDGCKSNADCDPGEVCINGNCIPGCQSDADCVEGYICLLRVDFGELEDAEIQAILDEINEYIEPDITLDDILGITGICIPCLVGDLPCTVGGQCCSEVCEIEPDTVLGQCEHGPCEVPEDCPPGYGCEDGSCCVLEGNNCTESLAGCCGDLICDMKGSGNCVECLVDVDCPDGEICEEGVCVPECTTDLDCDPVEFCDLDDKNPTYQTCLPDLPLGENCDRPGMCLSDACDQVCVCDDNGDCPKETPVCDTSTGDCVECLGDKDCTDPSKPKCSPDNTCVPCLGDDDCPGTQICVDYTCIPECTSDADCPDGQICEAEVCVPGCRDDGDCIDPALPVCDVPNKTCVECLDASHCPGTQICVDYTCVPECTTDDDCPAGEICEEEVCVPGCRDNDDCIDPNFPICYEGTCVDCLLNGSSCAIGNGCCGICDNVTAICMDCLPNGSACEEGISDSDCCTGLCDIYTCVECKEENTSCSVNSDCCEGYFCDGICKPLIPDLEECDANKDYQCQSNDCHHCTCRPFIQREVGEPCFDHAWCISGLCSINQPEYSENCPNAGKCLPDPCDVENPCPSGFECISNACEKI